MIGYPSRWWAVLARRDTGEDVVALFLMEGDARFFLGSHGEDIVRRLGYRLARVKNSGGSIEIDEPKEAA